MGLKDARIQPIYACKHRVFIELIDSNKAPIALADADTELIKGEAAAADATNEMSEITTGYCKLDLTYAEMSYTFVGIIPNSTGALTRLIKLYPVRLPVLRSGTAQAGAAATMTLDSGASAKDGAYVGCMLRCSNNTPAGVQGDVSLIIAYVGDTKVATVADSWSDTPTSSTTFEILVPDSMAVATLLATKEQLATQVSTNMAILKNSATKDLPFVMRDNTNHEPASGKTVTGTVSIDGAEPVAVSGAISEVTNGAGRYKLAAHATDRNGDTLLFLFSAEGCDKLPVLMVTGE